MAPDESVTRSLSRAQRIGWLRLIRADNVGPVNFRLLVNRFGSAEAALDRLPGLAHRGGKSAPRIPSRAEAEDELAAIEAMGGQMVALGEPAYPPLLQHIHAPPPILSILGGGKIDWSRCIGMVGSRNASAAGRKMAANLAAGLGEAGYSVVSGFARGIDAAAHRASLSTGTVGMLAGGMDRIYPEEHSELAEDVVASGGALVSEMRLGWDPRSRDFPRRNRLISGVSLGVVVVEAARRSGSLITARTGLEQNREIFAVPGSPLDPRAGGTNDLLRQGATLVTSAEDILEALAQPGRQQEFRFEDDHESGMPELLPDAEPDDTGRDKVLAALSPTPVHVDELVQQSGLSASAVQMVLLELELAGRLERSGGQLVALVAPGD
jgi:DNA processing protein